MTRKLDLMDDEKERSAGISDWKREKGQERRKEKIDSSQNSKLDRFFVKTLSASTYLQGSQAYMYTYTSLGPPLFSRSPHVLSISHSQEGRRDKQTQRAGTK